MNVRKTSSSVSGTLALATATIILCRKTIEENGNSSLDFYGMGLTAMFVSAVVCFIGSLSSDFPLPATPEIILGNPGYNLDPIVAPATRGKHLVLLSRLICRTPVGNLILRPFINKNRPEIIRSLADQAAKQGYPLVTFPVCKATTKVGTVSDQMANTATQAFKYGMLPRSYESDDLIGVLDYCEAYSSGKVLPSEMVSRVLDAMEKLEHLRIFVRCDKADVKAQARQSDERWKARKPLSVFDGVPISVKDMIQVTGYKKSNGLIIHEGDPVSHVDDIMVRRFRDAGAIILGTTVMTEYGRCPLGYNSHYQGPFNPYDETRYSGGSSSGSVLSVMTGLVPIGISFDGGGSIRIPAALSGAFGLAPTFSRIPWDGESAKTSGMIHAGVNTATATDTALAYALLAQVEPNHYVTNFYSGGFQDLPRPHLTDFDKIDDFSGLRVGVYWDYFLDADEEIVLHCKGVVNALVKRGAQVVEVSIPHLNELSLAHGMAMSNDFSMLHEHDFFHRKDLEPATMIQLSIGRSFSALEVGSCNRLRGWAISYIRELFAEKIDIFVTPGCPVIAPPIAEATRCHGESNLPLFRTVMRYMFLTNLVGFPSMAMPVGYSQDEGLPISCQMMADHWNDALLLRLSHFVEKCILKRKLPKHHIDLKL